jgi:predicted nucleic acid-binding Zn finger protein
MIRHRSRSTRLVLEIAETRYVLRAVACSETIGRAAFRLVKDDGTVYDLVQTTHGPECDCPDFIFRRDGLAPKGCKHVQALIAAGMMAPHKNRSLVGGARVAYPPGRVESSAVTM